MSTSMSTSTSTSTTSASASAAASTSTYTSLWTLQETKALIAVWGLSGKCAEPAGRTVLSKPHPAYSSFFLKSSSSLLHNQHVHSQKNER